MKKIIFYTKTLICVLATVCITHMYSMMTPEASREVTNIVRWHGPLPKNNPENIVRWHKSPPSKPSREEKLVSPVLPKPYLTPNFLQELTNWQPTVRKNFLRDVTIQDWTDMVRVHGLKRMIEVVRHYCFSNDLLGAIEAQQFMVNEPDHIRNAISFNLRYSGYVIARKAIDIKEPNMILAIKGTLLTSAINASCWDGSPVLHHAVRHGLKDYVRNLLEVGAMVDQCDLSGKTALDCVDKKDAEMRELLCVHRAKNGEEFWKELLRKADHDAGRNQARDFERFHREMAPTSPLASMPAIMYKLFFSELGEKYLRAFIARE